MLNYGVFYRCSGITSLDLTGYTSIGGSAFRYCSNLSSISIPNCSYIGENAFTSCYNLSSIDITCSYIGAGAFSNCSKLESVYVLSTSIPTLSGSTVFQYTPLSQSSYLGYFGSIYVLSSLVDSFKTTQYWSYYSSRITAYIE